MIGKKVKGFFSYVVFPIVVGVGVFFLISGLTSEQ